MNAALQKDLDRGLIAGLSLATSAAAELPMIEPEALETGAADNDDAAWATATADLTPWAGRMVRLRVEAADAAAPSLVEAAVDNVQVVQIPD